MPAPLVVVAVLPSTSLPVMTALPPLAMPPAAIGGAHRSRSRDRRRRRVAVHLAEEDRERSRARRRTAWAASGAIAARNASTVEGGVPVDLADVERDITSEVLDATAPGVRSGVVVHLAEVERELAGRAGRTHEVPGGDAATGGATSEVVRHPGEVERGVALGIDDAATVAVKVVPSLDCCCSSPRCR